MNLMLLDMQDCFPKLSLEKATLYRPHLESAMTQADIRPIYRAAAFLAQLRHESDSLRTWMEVGGSLRPYAPFYGRGPIQLTHEYNYRVCGAALGLDLVGTPDAVYRPEVGFRVATWYWQEHALNDLADRLENSERVYFDAISKAIQGAKAPKQSLDSRWWCYQQILPVMSAPRVFAP